MAKVIATRVPGKRGTGGTETISAATSVKIMFCIFQNRETKAYKWLSLESVPGTNGRYLCESTADAAAIPAQKPAGCKTSPASYADYETAVGRIEGEGYDIVTQL